MSQVAASHFPRDFAGQEVSRGNPKVTEKQAGAFAIAMAYARAYHATRESPKICNDFLAASLFTPEEHTQTGET
jgi:O-methyltransferase involved in polyketide biosynthesis